MCLAKTTLGIRPAGRQRCRLSPVLAVASIVGNARPSLSFLGSCPDGNVANRLDFRGLLQLVTRLSAIDGHNLVGDQVTTTTTQHGTLALLCQLRVLLDEMLCSKRQQNFEENTFVFFPAPSIPLGSFATRAALALTVLIRGRRLIMAILDAIGRLAISQESGVAR